MILNRNTLRLFLVHGFIAVVVSASDKEMTDGSHTTKATRRRRGPVVLEDINTAAIETYLNALENFDIQSTESFQSSCQTLTSSIKALAQCVQLMRGDHLTAPLYTFVNMRRSAFPDIQYRVTYREYEHRDKPDKVRRIDIMVQRKDGLLFALKLWDLAEAVDTLKRVEVRKVLNNETHNFFKSFKRPVPHWVLASLNFTRKRGRLTGINASYLLDTYDTAKAVHIFLD